MFSSTIEIKGSKDILESYYNALRLEEDFKSERARYELKLQKTKLVINITADDATAFRAVSNTIAGLLSIVEKSINAVKQHG